jgi:hypothetical protein
MTYDDPDAFATQLLGDGTPILAEEKRLAFALWAEARDLGLDVREHAVEALYALERAFDAESPITDAQIDALAVLLLFENHVSNLVALGLAEPASADRLSITEGGQRSLAALRAETERYARQHGDCRGGRQRVGHGPQHCFECCPPPPMSPEQIERVAAILRE